MKQKKNRYQLFRKGAYRSTAVLMTAALTFPLAVRMSDKGANKQVFAASISSGLAAGNSLASVNFQTYDEKLKEAQDKVKELENNRNNLENKIADLEKKKNDILGYIEELDAQLNEITANLEELDASILETKDDLEKTQKELDEAKETEKAQYETMKRRIQYLYENGSDDILSVFLSSGNIVDFLNQVEYSKKISEYDNTLLQSYIATKELIEDQEAYLSAKLSELQTAEENQLYEQSQLQELSAAKSAELIKYTESIGADMELFQEYSDQIASGKQSVQEIKDEEAKRVAEEKRKAEEAERKRKEEEERKKKEEQDRLNAAGSITQTGETSADKMIWPLPGDGRVYAKFGYRVAPTAGASTFHRGWDIGGEMGAQIVSVLAGTVEAASYSVSGGNYVNINHGNGLVTRYLHCSKLLVNVGDTVKQGQVIALVGSTGISTGPHLHFSVVINGVNVDPEGYISYK